MKKNSLALNMPGRIVMALLLCLIIWLVCEHLIKIIRLKNEGIQAEAVIKAYIPEHTTGKGSRTYYYHLLEYDGLVVKTELTSPYEIGSKIGIIHDRKDPNLLIVGNKSMGFAAIYMINSRGQDISFIVFMFLLAFYIIFAPTVEGGKWQPFWRLKPGEDGAVTPELGRAAPALIFSIVGLILPFFFITTGPHAVVMLLAQKNSAIIYNDPATMIYILSFLAFIYPAIFYIFIKINTGDFMNNFISGAETDVIKKKTHKRKRKFRINMFAAYMAAVFTAMAWSLFQFYEINADGIIKHNFPAKDTVYGWGKVVSVKAKARGYLETDKHPEFRFAVSLWDGKDLEVFSSAMSGVQNDKQVFQCFNWAYDGVKAYGRDRIKFDVTEQGYGFLEEISNGGIRLLTLKLNP